MERHKQRTEHIAKKKEAQCWESRADISSSSCFPNQYHVMAAFCKCSPRTVRGGGSGWLEGKTLPQYIFFCISLFTKAVVCDRNSGESQVPQKLTILLHPLETSANIHPTTTTTNTHTATCSAVDAFTQHMRFQSVRTQKNCLPFISRGDYWLSLRLVACTSVRHLHLSFIQHPPNSILESGTCTPVHF